MTEFEVIAEILVRLYESAMTETRMKKDRNEELKS